MPIRKARTEDVKEVQGLINGYAKKHKMIPRSLSDLYDNIRDVFIYEDKGRIKGTCALHVSWEDLAEIRSLAVDKPYRSKGIGSALIKKAIQEAKGLGVRRVFVLTYYPEYFKRFGFEDIDKSKLPNKIWSDCLHCPHFPECDEVALIKEIG